MLASPHSKKGEFTFSDGPNPHRQQNLEQRELYGHVESVPRRTLMGLQGCCLMGDGGGKKIRGGQRLLFWDKLLRKFVCILVSVAIHAPQQMHQPQPFR